MATEARSNLRQDLIKAGLSTLAADLLANLFAAQQKQFEGLVGVLFPNVDRPWGVKPYPASAASGVISAGMLVRTTPNSLVPATGEGGDANLWANAFVMGVVGTGATAQIYTAQGAASALLMVNEPVAGEKVSLLRGGMGTCSSITGSYDLQPVAQCEVSQTDTGGLALCSGIAFQTPLNQSLDGFFWRTDGSSSPSTGPWVLGGSSLANLNFWQTTLFGGNPYAGAWFQAQGGLDSLGAAIIGGTGDPDDDSTFDWTHALFFPAASESSIFYSGDATFTTNTTLGFVAPTGSRVQLFQDASGTIALLQASNTQVIDAAGDVIDPTITNFIILTNSTGASITLTSAPTIAAGFDGQEITIVNGSGTAGANGQIVIPTEQTTAGCLVAGQNVLTFPLQKEDALMLKYSATVGLWIRTADTANN